MRSTTFITASCWLLAACGPDAGSSGDGMAVGTGDDPGASDTASGGVVDGSSGAVPPQFEPYPARGIVLTDVFADHGISVPIVQGGQWVDGSGRNAALIAGRNTLIRGFWALEPGFEPRELESRLTLTYPDGREETASRNFVAEGESVAVDLESTVYFIVPAELMQTGVQFRIELFETTEGYRDLPEPAQTSFPPQSSLLGLEGDDMALRVVLVPMDHDLGENCPEPPEITDEEMQYLADQLFMQNPVQRVEIERRDTVAYTDPMSGFGGPLGFLADLRETDDADPGVYYYGVVRPCDGGPQGVGGQAITIPDFPREDNSWVRTAIGRWDNSLSTTANTFVHEIGHTQGRRHVACNGDEGGPNPLYPYEGGDIATWGFGTEDFTLHGPNSKDYMTYCGNTWVSDWGWSRIVPYIREITSWDAARSAAPPPSSQVLLGLIEPKSGDESWVVTRGTASGLFVDGHEAMTFVTADGLSSEIEAVVSPMGDDGAYTIVAELPDALVPHAGMTISHRSGGERRVIERVKVGGRTVMLAN